MSRYVDPNETNQPWAITPSTPWPGPDSTVHPVSGATYPKKPRRWPWIAAGVIAVVLGLCAVLTFIGLGATHTTGSHAFEGRNVATIAPPLTEATAKRECRTAFQSEFQTRIDAVDEKNTSDIEMVTTVQSIEMLESWKTSTGYDVNGTVHYTVTAGVIDPVTATLDLTCRAYGTEDSVSTAVSNRS